MDSKTRHDFRSLYASIKMGLELIQDNIETNPKLAKEISAKALNKLSQIEEILLSFKGKARGNKR